MATKKAKKAKAKSKAASKKVVKLESKKPAKAQRSTISRRCKYRPRRARRTLEVYYFYISSRHKRHGFFTST